MTSLASDERGSEINHFSTEHEGTYCCTRAGCDYHVNPHSSDCPNFYADFGSDALGHDHPRKLDCRPGCPKFVLTQQDYRQDPSFADFDLDALGHDHPRKLDCLPGCPKYRFY